MIRRLIIFLLCIAAVILVFVNVSLYLGLGGESTDALVPDLPLSTALSDESGQMARGLDDQLSFVRDKLSREPVPYRRPQIASRDPFGIVTKTEKEEIVFNYKLFGIVGDAENGFVAVLSDGKQTVFVKEGQTIGQTPFVLKKLDPYSAEISGPKEIRLGLGGGK